MGLSYRVRGGATRDLIKLIKRDKGNALEDDNFQEY
jgi:hypothetical protein